MLVADLRVKMVIQSKDIQQPRAVPKQQVVSVVVLQAAPMVLRFKVPNMLIMVYIQEQQELLVEAAEALMVIPKVMDPAAAVDTLDIDTTQWATSSSVRNADVIYDIWNHNTSAAQLLVQQGVQVI